MSELARALGLLRIFGRDLSRAEAIVDRLPAQPFRARFKPGVFDGQGRSQTCGVFCGLRRRRGQPRGRRGHTRPVAALQPERPRAQQQLLRSARVVLWGSFCGAQAGGQEPAGARSRKRRRHRHGLFELHRLHQEISASVFRRRSAAQGRPRRGRQGQRRLGVACRRSHPLLQIAARANALRSTTPATPRAARAW